MTDSEQREQAMTPEEIERIRAQNEARRLRINAEVSAIVRTPFARLISDYLQCQPSQEAIQKFANAYPDRFATALAQLAPLAGYRKEVNISADVTIIHSLADSTLQARLLESEKRLIELRHQRLLDAAPIHQNASQAMQANQSIDLQREAQAKAMQGNEATDIWMDESNKQETAHQGDSIPEGQTNDQNQDSEGKSTMPSLTRIPDETRHTIEFEQSIIDQ